MQLPWRVLCGLAFLCGLWLHGYTTGGASVRAEVAQNTAQLQQDLIAASARARVTAAALQAMRAANATALEDFKNEATNDSAAGLRRPDPDSVQRLKTLFARQRAATR
jgi:hypothetical protein